MHIFSHTNMYSSWAVPHTHTRLHNTEPNQRGRFLKITSLYCNARTDWLSPGETNTDPQVIQEVGSRKGDALLTHTHTHTHTHTNTPSFQLSDKTTHSKCSFANDYTPPIQGFSVWYGLSLVHILSQNPFLSLKMDQGPVLVATAVWKLRNK